MVGDRLAVCQPILAPLYGGRVAGTRRTRQAEETRLLLRSVALELFTEQGYADTSIESIVQGAGVARGALYHHFDSKLAVFREVYDEVQADVTGRVVAAALAASSPWEAVHVGLATFLDACLEPAFRRIVVLDSISILQHQVWSGAAEPVELQMLRSVLTPLLDADQLPGVTVEPLIHVALGGLYGAALFIARSDDPPAARAEVDGILDTLVDGLLGQVSAFRPSN